MRSSTSGIIFSNKAGTYTNRMSCAWSLSANTKLRLVFFRFVTESSHDRVSVYNGTSSSSPRIGQYSGSTLPAAITSSGNNLFIKFTTDGSVTRSGFAASYHGKSTRLFCVLVSLIFFNILTMIIMKIIIKIIMR